MVEFAINTTVAEGVGKAPVELVYGEQLRSPLDAILGAPGSTVGAG